MTGRAAILGLGERGAKWAETCLAAGWDVTGFDPDDRAGASISGGASWRRETTISGAVKRADWVICCLPDRIELMRPVIKRAQASAPGGALVAVVSEAHDIEAVQGCAIRPSDVFRLLDGEKGELALDLSSRNDGAARDAATAALAVLNAARAVIPARQGDTDMRDASGL